MAQLVPLRANAAGLLLTPGRVPFKPKLCAPPPAPMTLFHDTLVAVTVAAGWL
jgi:hypothetical protein